MGAYLFLIRIEQRQIGIAQSSLREVRWTCTVMEGIICRAPIWTFRVINRQIYQRLSMDFPIVRWKNTKRVIMTAFQRLQWRWQKNPPCLLWISLCRVKIIILSLFTTKIEWKLRSSSITRASLFLLMREPSWASTIGFSITWSNLLKKRSMSKIGRRKRSKERSLNSAKTTHKF